MESFVGLLYFIVTLFLQLLLALAVSILVVYVWFRSSYSAYSEFPKGRFFQRIFVVFIVVVAIYFLGLALSVPR